MLHKIMTSIIIIIATGYLIGGSIAIYMSIVDNIKNKKNKHFLNRRI